MRLFLFLLLALPAFAVGSRHTFITPEEISGFGDFENDGRLDAVVIDRSTGQIRIGSQQPDGSLTWSGPFPSGIGDPSSLSVGPVTDPTRDQLLVTGPFANRVHLLEPGAPFTSPVALFESTGPESVVAIDLALPGNDPSRMDVAVYSELNSFPAHRRDLFQTIGSTITNQGTNGTLATWNRAARVRTANNQPPRLAYFERDTTDTFVILDPTNAALPVLDSLPGLGAGSDFIEGSFIASQSNRIQFLFYVPSQTDLRSVGLNPTSLTFTTPGATTDLGAGPIDAVFNVRRGTRDGALVLFNNGAEARLYEFNSSGNPLLRETFVAPAGRRFTGGLGYVADQLAILTGAASGGPSTHATHYQHDGSAWVEQATAALPTRGASTTLTNVFLYNQEPLVDPDARLLKTIQVPDWSSGFLVDASGNVTVTSQQFADPANGLGPPATFSVGTHPGTTHGFANQLRPDVSLTTDDPTLGLLPPTITISPPAGEYGTYLTPRLTVPDPASLPPGFQAFYRTDPAANWTSFDVTDPTEVITPPNGTLAPFSVWFYAAQSGQRSPITRTDYTWSGPAASLDSDRDGVPDFVELDRGTDPLTGQDTDADDLPDTPASDWDGDGFSDLEELLAGTDPANPASKPAAHTLDAQNSYDLAVRFLMHNGNVANPIFRIPWPASNTDHEPATMRLHSLGGEFYGSAVAEANNLPGIGNTNALFEAVPATARDSFVIAATTPTFNFHWPSGADSSGPEMIAMMPVPTLDAGAPSFLADPGLTPTANAAQWIAAAQAYYNNLERPLVSAQIFPLDTLKFLLTERILGILARADDPSLPTDHLSLTEFRDLIPPVAPADHTGNRNIVLEAQALLDLSAFDATRSSAPSGHLLQSVFTQVSTIVDTDNDVRIQQIRSLTNDLYGYYVQDANSATPQPGLFPNPVDSLRAIVQDLPVLPTGFDDQIPIPGDQNVPPASYAAALNYSATTQRLVELALPYILDLLTARPTQTYTARITATTFAGAVRTLENTADGSPLHLLTGEGSPFSFSPSLDLPVGSIVEILAFTDRLIAPDLEVISATLLSVPAPALVDTNNDLLDDDLAAYFFPGGTDPFGDPDDDGYTTFQELLDDSDPTNSGIFPSTAAFPSAVSLTVVPLPNGDLHLSFPFPSVYASQVGFDLLTSDLLTPFQEAGMTASSENSTTFSLTITPPASDRQFYRFRPFLK